MTDHEEHPEHDFTGPLTPPVARLIKALLGVCAILFAADFFVDRKVHAPGEGFPGFYAIYGFVGCAILVLAAKELRKLVMRPPNYYDPVQSDLDLPSYARGPEPPKGGGDDR